MKNVLKVLWNPSLRKALRRIWMAQSRYALTVKQWHLNNKNLQTQKSLQQQQPLKGPQLPTTEMGPNADKRSSNLSLAYLFWEFFYILFYISLFKFLLIYFRCYCIIYFSKGKKRKNSHNKTLQLC